MSRHLYIWFLRLLLPYVLLRLMWRGLRNPDYWRRIPERFGFIDTLPPPRAIWIHAVSVGEVRAAAPLVHELTVRYPEHPLLITTMTPTGSAQVRELFDGSVAHCYAPYDYPAAVRRFLDRANPVMAIVMETELWPNIFHLCRARAIPVFVTNVRMSESSMRKYQRFAGAGARHAATGEPLRGAITGGRATAAHARRRPGIRRGHRQHQVRDQHGREHARGRRGAAPRLGTGPPGVARGQHPRGRGGDGARGAGRAEKAGTLRQHAAGAGAAPPRALRRPWPGCAKRTIASRCAARTRGVLDPSVEILVGDTMGELQLFFGAADVAFIGGSLVPTGGHNLLEASAVGKPVVFGPHMFNFQEISQMTLERGAGVQIQSPHQLAPAVSDFLGNANRRDSAGLAGRKMVEENRGALTANMRLIEELLK